MQMLVALPLAALVRLFLAVSDQGMFWPDEIFNTVEPGHRIAFGYGFTSWEYAGGYRSWALPGILAGYLRASSLLGLHSGLALMCSVKVLLALIGVATIALTMILAWRIGGSTASLIAASLSIAFPMLLVFGNHSFSESFSVPLVTAAAALVVTSTTSVQAARIAGLVAGASALIRPQNAVFVVALFVVMALRPAKRPAAQFGFLVVGVAIFAGALDWITWGKPFVSYWRYFQADRHSISFKDVSGASPWNFYLTKLVSSNSLLVGIVVIGLILVARRLPGFVTIVFSYIVIHSFIIHKELRFILPIIPLALALAAIGIGGLIDSEIEKVRKERASSRRAFQSREDLRGLRAIVISCAVAVALVFGVAANRATFGSFGETRAWTAKQSVWYNLDGYNRLLSRVGTGRFICGLAVTPINVIWFGGYSYLHRDIPMFYIDPNALVTTGKVPSGANAVLMDERIASPPGFRRIATSRGVVLVMRSGTCGKPPATFTPIFPKPF
jgi:GPI mannosyltransferase 3